MYRIMCFIHGFALVILLTLMPTQSSTYLVRQRTGCYHNGTWYGEKSFVPAMENCLACECKQKKLVCRRKVCPEMPVPPPRGCIIIQKRNTCCPYLSCARLETYQHLPTTRRIIAYLNHYERESIDRVVNDNMLQRRSDDSDIDTYVCVKNGTVYKSGSAMSSSSMCTYCYCIGGSEKCVKPKCMLPVDGCKPIFVDSTCCPVRYDCSIKSSGKSSQEVLYRKTNNKHFMRMSQRLQRNRGCTVGRQFYAEGQKMKSDADKPCDICFCIRGNRRCAPKKCSPPLKNCIPVVPKGQCCPSSYDCDDYHHADYERADNARQFNLFSFFFNDDPSTNTSKIPVEYPHDRNPAIVAPFTQSLPLKNNTESSIFDKIRQGLEFIDTNNDSLMDDSTMSVPLESMQTTRPNVSATTSEMSLLDLLLESEIKEEEPVERMDEFKEQTTTSPNIMSWIDILMGSEDMISTTLQPPPDNRPSEESTENISTSVSVVEENDSTTEFLSTTDMSASTTDMKYWDSTTPTLHTMEDSTLYFSTSPFSVKKETVQQEIESKTSPNKKLSNETMTKIVNSTEIFSTTEKTSSNFTATTISPVQLLNVTVPTVTKRPQVLTETTEKTSSFLSAFLDEISIILNEKAQNKSSFDKLNLKQVAERVSTTLKPTSSTLGLDASKVVPMFKPIPTKKSNIRINSKITHLAAATDPPMRTKVQNMSTHTNNTTKKPIEIKTILESEPYERNQGTLPPSLPNLKIIPFLPTDAVKVDRKKPNYEGFYNNLPIDKIDYDIYDDKPRYPSVIESFPSYDNVHDENKAEYIYKFNIEGPPVSSISGTSGVKIKGFSPPTKTEGGFLPKESIRNNDPIATQNDDFQSQKYLIDITTSVPLYESSTKAIDITTPDPFKDVIRTEPSPDLSPIKGHQEISAIYQQYHNNNNTFNATSEISGLNTYSNLLLKKMISKSPLAASTEGSSSMAPLSSTVPQFKKLPLPTTTLRTTTVKNKVKLQTRITHPTRQVSKVTMPQSPTTEKSATSTTGTTKRKQSRPTITTERIPFNTKATTITSSPAPVLPSLEIRPFMEASYEVFPSRANGHMKSGSESSANNLKVMQELTTNKAISRTTSVQTSQNNMLDSFGTLKLAGCNIYGRMYRVDRIIVELSNSCRECKCTEVGVDCQSLDCESK